MLLSGPYSSSARQVGCEHELEGARSHLATSPRGEPNPGHASRCHLLQLSRDAPLSHQHPMQHQGFVCKREQLNPMLVTGLLAIQKLTGPCFPSLQYPSIYTWQLAVAHNLTAAAVIEKATTGSAPPYANQADYQPIDSIIAVAEKSGRSLPRHPTESPPRHNAATVKSTWPVSQVGRGQFLDILLKQHPTVFASVHFYNRLKSSRARICWQWGPLSVMCSGH